MRLVKSDSTFLRCHTYFCTEIDGFSNVHPPPTSGQNPEEGQELPQDPGQTAVCNENATTSRPLTQRYGLHEQSLPGLQAPHLLAGVKIDWFLTHLLGTFPESITQLDMEVSYQRKHRQALPERELLNVSQTIPEVELDPLPRLRAASQKSAAHTNLIANTRQSSAIHFCYNYPFWTFQLRPSRSLLGAGAVSFPSSSLGQPGSNLRPSIEPAKSPGGPGPSAAAYR